MAFTLFNPAITSEILSLLIFQFLLKWCLIIVLFSLWSLCSNLLKKIATLVKYGRKLIDVCGYLKIIQGEHQVVFSRLSDFDLNSLFLE